MNDRKKPMSEYRHPYPSQWIMAAEDLILALGGRPGSGAGTTWDFPLDGSYSAETHPQLHRYLCWPDSRPFAVPMVDAAALADEMEPLIRLIPVKSSREWLAWQVESLREAVADGRPYRFEEGLLPSEESAFHGHWGDRIGNQDLVALLEVWGRRAEAERGMGSDRKEPSLVHRALLELRSLRVEHEQDYDDPTELLTAAERAKCLKDDEYSQRHPVLSGERGGGGG